jgi:hypothetical protein
VKSEPAQRSEDDGALENGTVVVGLLGRTRLNEVVLATVAS